MRVFDSEYKKTCQSKQQLVRATKKNVNHRFNNEIVNAIAKISINCSNPGLTLYSQQYYNDKIHRQQANSSRRTKQRKTCLIALRGLTDNISYNEIYEIRNIFQILNCNHNSTASLRQWRCQIIARKKKCASSIEFKLKNKKQICERYVCISNKSMRNYVAIKA